MVLHVALYVPWCRHLEALPDVGPQLYADNLKCSAGRPGALFVVCSFHSAVMSSLLVRVCPLVNVFFVSTSESVRKAMKLWHISGVVAFGRFSWMSGILVVILISLGGLVLELFPKELVSAIRLGFLPLVLYLLGFHVHLGLVRGKYLPAGLHAAEASCVSSSAIGAFRAAIVRAVWSSETASCNSCNCLMGLDLLTDACFSFCLGSRFRMMRRCLAYCPGEEPRIFTDVGSRFLGVLRVMVLSISFLSLLLSWGLPGMGRKKGGFGSALPHSQNDDWACAALLLFYSGCLAFLFFCQAF